jgi:hypothetical protein
MRGYRVRDVIARMSKFFVPICHYRNVDWNSSHNFVLRSRRHSDV